MRSVMDDERRQLEWRALRWLCSAGWPPGERGELLRRILPRDSELFLVYEHRAILEELAFLADQPRERIRELLQARLTNRGLPDVDVAGLFTGKVPGSAEALAIQTWLGLA